MFIFDYEIIRWQLECVEGHAVKTYLFGLLLDAVIS
jgi:hypothetical protein